MGEERDFRGIVEAKDHGRVFEAKHGKHSKIPFVPGVLIASPLCPAADVSMLPVFGNARQDNRCFKHLYLPRGKASGVARSIDR